MSDDLLKEQLAYYRARAQEYDESVQHTGRYASGGPLNPQVDADWQAAISAIHALPPADSVLELACGTGLWTRELLHVAKHITALDGAPEMLALNRANVNDDRVTYQQVDLFTWQPEAQYDLVMFGFFLSHVPIARLDTFLDAVAQAVRPGGRVFMVDEHHASERLSGHNEEGQYQRRTVHDGRTFQIVKVYYDPADIQSALAERGFEHFDVAAGRYFFHLIGTKPNS
jgi:2-polyprenyl-3-methyl-5-hydroxy-6-metoxy-1,4-benzoquinol methylase